MKRFIAMPSGPVQVDAIALHQHGAIRLMIHETPPSAIIRPPFRASEETTGYAIPETFGVTPDESLGRALAMIAHVGEAKFKRAIAGKPVLNP